MDSNDEAAAESRLEMMVEAALAGYDMGAFEPADTTAGGNEAECRRCGRSVWMGENGFIYSLLADQCREQPDDGLCWVYGYSLWSGGQMTPRRSLRVSQKASDQDGQPEDGPFDPTLPVLAAVCFVLGMGSGVLVYLFLPPWAWWAYGILSVLGAAAIWFGKFRGR